MFLIKILGNHKTGDLNLEIRYKDIVEVMNNITFEQSLLIVRINDCGQKTSM